jgi:pimeloyl-ACP methyl ester carboxylesterase
MTANPDSDAAIDRRRLFAAAGLGGAALAMASAARSAPLADAGPLAKPLPVQAPAQTGVAKLADVDLWYWDTGGSGPPIVLFHPMTGSGHVFSYQQPVFAQAGYRVIGYSRRGFNGSGAGPPDRTGTGSGDLAGLLDVLKIDRFHSVATAGGGFVAADFALSHPDRLLSLTLACTILAAQGGDFDTLKTALTDPAIDHLPAYLRELGPSFRAVDPAGVAQWRELERLSAPTRVAQAFANTITLEALERLRMPVLLIAGDADLIAPPPFLRLFARHIPGARLEIITESGHSAYWERPDAFNAAVLNFIRGR